MIKVEVKKVWYNHKVQKAVVSVRNYAYKKALSLKFKNKIKNLKNPYFQKDTSIKVANIIFKLLNKYAN